MCDPNDSLADTVELSLLDLPVEIFLHICSFLDAYELVDSLSLVCKQFHAILNDDVLWKTRISRLWPQSSFPALPPAEEDGLFWKKSCAAIERQAMLWGKNVPGSMEKVSLSNLHYGTIDGILLMNKGTVCISGARDRSLVTSVLFTGENEHVVSKLTSNAHDGWIWDLASLNDTVYSCSWDSTVKAWQLTDVGLIPLKTYEMYMVTRLVWNVSGALLCVTSSRELGIFATGSFCKTVLLIDPRIGLPPVVKYKPHQRAIIRLEMNSKYIFSASEDKTVSIFDQAAGKTMANVKISDNAFPMSISMREDTVYVGDSTAKLHLLNPKQNFNLVKSYSTGHTKAITGIHQAPGCLLTSSLDETVRISSPTDPPRLMTTIQSSYGDIPSIDYLNEVLAISGTDAIEIWRPKTRV